MVQILDESGSNLIVQYRTNGSHFLYLVFRSDTTKKEANRMVKAGILTCEGKSEWGFPSLIIQKLNQMVKFILDFREWNKLLKKKLGTWQKLQQEKNMAEAEETMPQSYNI